MKNIFFREFFTPSFDFKQDKIRLFYDLLQCLPSLRRRILIYVYSDNGCLGSSEDDVGVREALKQCGCDVLDRTWTAHNAEKVYRDFYTKVCGENSIRNIALLAFNLLGDYQCIYCTGIQEIFAKFKFKDEVIEYLVFQAVYRQSILDKGASRSQLFKMLRGISDNSGNKYSNTFSSESHNILLSLERGKDRDISRKYDELCLYFLNDTVRKGERKKYTSIFDLILACAIQTTSLSMNPYITEKYFDLSDLVKHFHLDLLDVEKLDKIVRELFFYIVERVTNINFVNCLANVDGAFRQSMYNLILPLFQYPLLKGRLSIFKLLSCDDVISSKCTDSYFRNEIADITKSKNRSEYLYNESLVDVLWQHNLVYFPLLVYVYSFILDILAENAPRALDDDSSYRYIDKPLFLKMDDELKPSISSDIDETKDIVGSMIRSVYFVTDEHVSDIIGSIINGDLDVTDKLRRILLYQQGDQRLASMVNSDMFIDISTSNINHYMGEALLSGKIIHNYLYGRYYKTK